MSKPKAYLDLYELPENKRCDVIADMIKAGQKVAFMVDDDGGAKADRYIKKVTNRCPSAIVVTREAGPVEGVISILMALPEKAGN